MELIRIGLKNQTAKELTKSEIREKRKHIEHELYTIKEQLPSIDKNCMPSTLILRALMAIQFNLDPIRIHIINNDDYPLALEINGMIAPVWSEYCNIKNDNGSYKHQEAYELEYIINDLQNWIDEYETKHLKKNTKKNTIRKKVPHDFFKCTINQEKACQIFKQLKGQYIDSSTEINDWLLACGFPSNDKTPFKPIKWLAQLNELVYLIDELFSSCRCRWKATEHCFTINGKPPHNGAMRAESAARTITEEKISKIDKILKIR